MVNVINALVRYRTCLAAAIFGTEFENYEMLIEKNLKVKSLVDNSLPVQD